MNTETSVNPIYSELSQDIPDLPTLAERCKLLAEILLDCNSLPQTQPVARCFAAYLDILQAELEKSMADFRVVEISDEQEQPEPRGWFLEDTETQCNYCRALNHVLLISHFDRDMLPHLTGLLHDMTHMMAEGLVASNHQPTVTVIHC
ncbi:hypothetical protein QQF54_11935 [Lelliottia sp. V106_10]|uniref:hypothetical protein n=1 Tax=Lelliottia wanjuensis TaxID=3050585 RepID=UPI0025510C61|nr:MULTISPECIES: hypothetical protein [unclassified Lelliottia]MDK9355893.1 hypothetical protein [Lelliottia sp. V106_16]MDK9374055.1 hypothetical protein [Lelliottia sp. V106_10]MDK9602026.1 hypothetical protein [Lelliottia sp. V106_5]